MVPYFSMYCFWLRDSVFEIGELIEAKSPQLVLITGATAATSSSISGGDTASGSMTGEVTGAAGSGGGVAGVGCEASATGAAGSSAGAGGPAEGASKSAKAATSSGSSTVTMMGVPTA